MDKHCPFCKCSDILKIGAEGPSNSRIYQCQNCFAEAYEDYWNKRPDMEITETLLKENHLLKVTNNDLRKIVRSGLHGLTEDRYEEIVKMLIATEIKSLVAEHKAIAAEKKREKAKLKLQKIENQKRETENSPEDLLPEEDRKGI